jgi:hypothetical protein
MTMSPDVLIYIQTVKEYFEKNEEARNYFLNNVNEERFFEYVNQTAQKNYDKEGEAMLSQIQLEEIRRSLIIESIENKKIPKENDPEENIYFNTKGFGRINLN